VRSKGVGGVRPRQASPRALAFGAGVAAAVVIAIVLGVVLRHSGGSNKNPVLGLGKFGNQNSAVALQGAGEANNLFKGIPQHGLILGKQTAPVEMEMFIDVQCPLCDYYEINYLPTVVQKYARTGKVQIHLQPWAFIGSQSFSGRLGVIAASFQNKGFEYAKVLYDNQPPDSENTGWLTSQEMAYIAASVTGLDLPKWWRDVNGSKAKSVAKGVDTLAAAKKIEGTPTVLVGCEGGTLRDVTTGRLVPTLQETEQAINAAACAK
jgi:protein-disulfide isomerase